MDTNEEKLLFKDEVFQIIGGAIVFNSIVVDTNMIDSDHRSRT